MGGERSAGELSDDGADEVSTTLYPPGSGSRNAGNAAAAAAAARGRRDRPLPLLGLSVPGRPPLAPRPFGQRLERASSGRGGIGDGSGGGGGGGCGADWGTHSDPLSGRMSIAPALGTAASDPDESLGWGKLDYGSPKPLLAAAGGGGGGGKFGAAPPPLSTRAALNELASSEPPSPGPPPPPPPPSGSLFGSSPASLSSLASPRLRERDSYPRAMQQKQPQPPAAAAAAGPRSVELSGLPYLPGASVRRYLGTVNLYFIKESIGVRNEYELGSFFLTFLLEVRHCKPTRNHCPR